jgi:hypothetical protein
VTYVGDGGCVLERGPTCCMPVSRKDDRSHQSQTASPRLASIHGGASHKDRTCGVTMEDASSHAFDDGRKERSQPTCNRSFRTKREPSRRLPLPNDKSHINTSSPFLLLFQFHKSAKSNRWLRIATSVKRSNGRARKVSPPPTTTNSPPQQHRTAEMFHNTPR